MGQSLLQTGLGPRGNVISDAIFKLISGDLTVAQLFFIRSIVAAVILAGVARFNGGGSSKMHDARWVLLRSGLLVGMRGLYYSALLVMPFAVAAAGLYTSPLMMAVFSKVLLKQRAGPTRWFAIFLGLVGVILLLSPGRDAFSIAMVLPFLAACCYALAAIITGSRCPDESPLALALNLNLCLALGGALTIALGAIFSGNMSVGEFVPSLEGEKWLILILLGVAMGVIAVGVAQAYQLAPAPTIGVFDNAYLAFAALLGVVLLGERLSGISIGGICLIGTSALLCGLSGRSSPANPHT